MGSARAEAQVNCTNTAEGTVCQVQQPFVSGTLVDIQTQKNLGLVTVGGGCSGTLVNRSWVLTADHCATSDGKIFGATAPVINLTISAAWTTRTAIPTAIIRAWTFGTVDVVAASRPTHLRKTAFDSPKLSCQTAVNL